jgi:MFS family permease
MGPDYYRNIPLLYIYSILIKRVSMPVIVLYFLLNNLNFTQIGMLAAVMSVTTLATEIHGGIFTDLHGKKISLAITSLLGTLTMLLYYIGNSFEYFLIASLLYGLSGAFISGTRNALLYDTLLKLGRVSEFKKFNGRQLLYSHSVNAVILLMIPLVYVIDPKLPFLIGILFFTGSLITALLFIEPPVKGTGNPSYNRRLKESFREISMNGHIFSAILLSTVTAAFVWMGSQFIQPLLLISGLEVIYFGVMYALMRAVMGLGGEFTHRLGGFLRFEHLLLLGLGMILASFLGFSHGFGAIIILSVLLMKFAEGLNRIALEDRMNRNIRSANRTTVLSISNLSVELFSAVIILIFGITADLAGVQGMFSFAIVAFMASLLFLAILRKRR